MSFGFSPGDVVMLGNFLLKVRGALKEDDGSRVQYLRATKKCEDFDAVLASIRRLDLSNATESFKEQLAKCAFDTQGVINDFRKTVTRYEKSMGESSSRGKVASAPRKIQWAFDAADDLDDFGKRLQSQLDRIQITLQGNLWEMMSKVERRTRLLDGPTRLILAPRRVSMRRNTWMAGGTAVPQIQDPIYENIGFIEDLLFGRFFRSQSPPSIPEMGRAFTLPDDASGAVAMTAMVPLRQPPSKEPESVPGPSQRNTHASSSPTQPKAPVGPLKQRSGMDLRDEINGLLRSLNLDELSPNEERQLHVPPAPQLVLEAPQTTENPTGGAQPTTFVEEPSPTGEQCSPPDGKPAEKHYRAVPVFSDFILSSSTRQREALLTMIDVAAQLAIEFRSLSYVNRKLLRLASTLSSTSEVLKMILQISQGNISGSGEDFVLNLTMEGERLVRAAGYLLESFSTRLSSRALDSLFKTIRFYAASKEIRNVTQALERLEGGFSFVLQIYHAEMTRNMYYIIVPE